MPEFDSSAMAVVMNERLIEKFPVKEPFREDRFPEIQFVSFGRKNDNCGRLCTNFVSVIHCAGLYVRLLFVDDKNHQHKGDARRFEHFASLSRDFQFFFLHFSRNRECIGSYCRFSLKSSVPGIWASKAPGIRLSPI
jgi:hypothetical protein